MKEPNIETPVEDDIRAYFNHALGPDKEIEIIPHTKVWATIAGTLLWDPKNGYADISAKPGLPLSESNIVTTTLKRVVYMTGPSESGKTRLVEMMRDAVELNRSEFIGFTDLSRTIKKYDNHETVVVCFNSSTPQSFNLDNALKIWCRERKLEYHHINLTSL